MVRHADAIDGLLHFAIAVIAPLHRVGGGRARFVQERQGFFQISGQQALQDLPHVREAVGALA